MPRRARRLSTMAREPTESGIDQTSGCCHRDWCTSCFSVNPFADFARTAVGWFEVDRQAGLEAAADMQDRPIVCLATNKGSEYAMYKCNRPILGAQGLQESELEVFISGHLCYAESEAMYRLANNVLNDLQIVVSDADRLSTVDDCQARGWSGPGKPDDAKYLTGWTSAIPWGSVRLLSPTGMEIRPSFDYLRNQDDYSEEDIQRLTSRLDPGS